MAELVAEGGARLVVVAQLGGEAVAVDGDDVQGVAAHRQTLDLGGAVDGEELEGGWGCPSGPARPEWRPSCSPPPSSRARCATGPSARRTTSRCRRSPRPASARRWPGR